jgi:hypothetical protein
MGQLAPGLQELDQLVACLIELCLRIDPGHLAEELFRVSDADVGE